MSTDFVNIFVKINKKENQNMKKVIVAFVSMLLMSLIITGCGKNQIPDLTEDEIKAIGEYTAFTLMKYDANHSSRL